MSWQDILKNKDEKRRLRVAERQRKKAEQKKINIAAEEADEPRRKQKRFDDYGIKIVAQERRERDYEKVKDEIIQLMLDAHDSDTGKTTIPESIPMATDNTLGNYWLTERTPHKINLYHVDFGHFMFPYPNEYHAAHALAKMVYPHKGAAKMIQMRKIKEFLESIKGETN